LAQVALEEQLEVQMALALLVALFPLQPVLAGLEFVFLSFHFELQGLLLLALLVLVQLEFPQLTELGRLGFLL
jgi:hypothetical protein